MTILGQQQLEVSHIQDVMMDKISAEFEKELGREMWVYLQDNTEAGSVSILMRYDIQGFSIRKDILKSTQIENAIAAIETRFNLKAQKSADKDPRYMIVRFV